MSTQKPKVTSSFAERELDKAQEQFDQFKENVESLTMDRMSAAPKEETEQQTKMSQREIQKSKDVYLKPVKRIGCKEQFNEKFRAAYEFDKEYVKIIAENKEIIGEAIEMWTRPYAGIPAEFWRVPVNTPVWAPRYLANQIKRKYYHRLKTENGMPTGGDGTAQYYGTIVVDTTVQRLDAIPAVERKTVFMGKSYF